jgi:hypothetical protein
MSLARVCTIAAVVLGLGACTRGADNPTPAAITPADSAPLPERIADPIPPVSSTLKPRLTPIPIPPATKSASAPAATLTLDLVALEKQLKTTKSIGIFSKIALKNQVDDLMKQFRDHYDGKTSITMVELRRAYDLLMMKVLSLVQDHDQTLASAIVSSRAAIWDLLADPKKFAALDI